MKTLWMVLLLAPLAWGETLEESVHDYLVNAEEQPTKEKWTVTGQLGVTITAGNSNTTTVAGGIEAKRPWDVWSVLLKYQGVFGKTGGDETANEHIFTERLERELEKDLAWLFQELVLEHDEQEFLSVRALLTFGYRRRLAKSESFVLFGEIGAGILYEDFRNSGDDTEAILQAGIDWIWNITKQLVYKQVIKVYPSLSNGGEFRIYAESNFETPVSDKVKLVLKILITHDTDAPAGVEETDLLVALTLSFAL